MNSKYRIVIADDESIIRLDVKELLEGAGFQIVGEASDGLQALALIEELQPDLALLDIKMPGLDGIEVAQRIGEGTPVVLLTAFSQRGLIEDAIRAGVVAYLVKPFKGDEVVGKITWLLSGEGQVDPLSTIDDKIETRGLLDQAKQLLAER